MITSRKPKTWSAFRDEVRALDGHNACDDPECSATLRSCTDCGGPLEIVINRNRPQIRVSCQACNGTIETFALETGGN